MATTVTDKSGNNTSPPTSQPNPAAGSSATLGTPLSAGDQSTGQSPVYKN